MIHNFNFHYTSKVEILYLISGLKTYFICGRVSPALNPVESKPSMIGSGKNLVLHTDAINEMAQVSKVEKTGFDLITLFLSENSNCCPECLLEVISQKIAGGYQQTFCFQKFVDSA